MKRASCMLLIAGLSAATAGAQQEYPYCQILDRVDAPAWEVHLGYDAEAEPDHSSDSYAVEQLKGGGGLLYLRGEYGALDISGSYDARNFTSDGGIGLPQHVYDLHLNLAYVLRNKMGQAAQVIARPGLYSELGDLSTDDVFMPLEVRGIQAVNDQLSMYLGAAFFPGFEHSVDPRFGVRYAPDDQWLIDIAYPESRVTYTPEQDWDIYADIKSDQTTEWQLDNGDSRKSLRYYETRATVGVNAPIAEDLRVMCQAGRIFGRKVDYADGLPDIGVDDAWFLTIGLGSGLQ